MSKLLQIDVITPTDNISIGIVEYLRAPSFDGLFGVKARHVSSIISIGSGEIKVTKNGSDTFYETNGGYADIKPEGIILILETFKKK